MEVWVFALFALSYKISCALVWEIWRKGSLIWASWALNWLRNPLFYSTWFQSRWDFLTNSSRIRGFICLKNTYPRSGKKKKVNRPRKPISILKTDLWSHQLSCAVVNSYVFSFYTFSCALYALINFFSCALISSHSLTLVRPDQVLCAFINSYLLSSALMHLLSCALISSRALSSTLMRSCQFSCLLPPQLLCALINSCALSSTLMRSPPSTFMRLNQLSFPLLPQMPCALI